MTLSIFTNEFHWYNSPYYDVILFSKYSEVLKSNKMSKISAIIPIYNEIENISNMHAKLTEALRGLDAEIIIVDDGSDDGSDKELKKYSDFIYLNIPHSGKSMAIKTGLQRVTGEIVVTIDADMQEDPKNIPPMLEKLNEGYNCIVGWRYKRKDNFFAKRLPSLIYNRLANLLFDIQLHDMNCGLKVCLTRNLRDIPWFNGSHRIIPLLIRSKGGSLSEFAVTHQPRQGGQAKFNSPIRFFEGLTHLIRLRLGHYG